MQSIAPRTRLVLLLPGCLLCVATAMPENRNRWTHDELLAPLFGALGSASLVVTPDGHVLVISDEARRRVDRTDRRAIIDIASVFADEPPLRDLLGALPETGEARIETLHARRNGEPVRVIARRLVAAGAGRPALLLLVMQGISQPGNVSVNTALPDGTIVADLVVAGKPSAGIDDTAPRLTALSLKDGLTGLPDRRSFTQRLSREWAMASQQGAVLSLIVADLDRFDAYNTAHGAEDGDRVLKQVALVIANAASRENDCAFRIGGEEFAVLLPGTPLSGGQSVAERIVGNLSTLALPHPSNDPDWITVSLGVAAAMPPAGESWRDLVRRAEGAVYLAKRDGRNRVVADPARLPKSRTRPVR